jgi:hypothetical protein
MLDPQPYFKHFIIRNLIHLFHQTSLPGNTVTNILSIFTQEMERFLKNYPRSVKERLQSGMAEDEDSDVEIILVSGENQNVNWH